jgi:hypothetical protein
MASANKPKAAEVEQVRRVYSVLKNFIFKAGIYIANRQAKFTDAEAAQILKHDKDAIKLKEGK